MSTQDLKHPWKPSVWIIWIGAIVLGSWLLQGIRICVKEPYFTIFCGKLCRIGQDHAEPAENLRGSLRFFVLGSRRFHMDLSCPCSFILCATNVRKWASS